MTSQPAPKIVVLGCIHATGAPSDGEIIPLPCGGRLDPASLIWGLAQGAQGVLLLSCAPDECRHRCQGSDCSASGAEVVSLAGRLIERAGLSPKRIARRTVRRSEDVGQLVDEYREQVGELGSWVRHDIPCAAIEPEPLHHERCLRLSARLQAAHGPYGRMPSLEGGDLFWPGCVDLRLSVAGAGGLPRAASELMSGLGKSVTSAPPRCCGKPLLPAREGEAFHRIAKSNVELIRNSGASRVITACSLCAETMSELYPETGVKLGIPVLDIQQWAIGRAELDTGATKIALVSARERDEKMASTIDWLSKSPAVNVLEEPWDGELPFGPDLRRAVLALTEEAAKAGATALVWSNSHTSAAAGASVSIGSWRTGPAIPSQDLTTALLGLVRPLLEDGSRTEKEG